MYLTDQHLVNSLIVGSAKEKLKFQRIAKSFSSYGVYPRLATVTRIAQAKREKVELKRKEHRVSKKIGIGRFLLFRFSHLTFHISLPMIWLAHF